MARAHEAPSVFTRTPLPALDSEGGGPARVVMAGVFDIDLDQPEEAASDEELEEGVSAAWPGRGRRGEGRPGLRGARRGTGLGSPTARLRPAEALRVLRLLLPRRTGRLLAALLALGREDEEDR